MSRSRKAVKAYAGVPCFETMQAMIFDELIPGRELRDLLPGELSQLRRDVAEINAEALHTKRTSKFGWNDDADWHATTRQALRLVDAEIRRDKAYRRKQLCLWPW